jgi:hypothetical protein
MPSEIATVERLQVILGVGDARVQALDLAVAAANQVVVRYCKREFEQKVRTVFLSGSGRPELILRQRPVQEILGLWVDPCGYYGKRAGAFPQSTQWSEGTHFVLRYDDPDGQMQSLSGIVERIGGSPSGSPGVGHHWWPTARGVEGGLAYCALPSWPRGQGNIKITYESGYAVMPEDLISAAEQIAVWIFKTLPEGGMPLQSERYEEYACSRAAHMLQTGGGEAILGSARQILARYREPQSFFG